MEIIGNGHLAKTIKESVENLGLAGDAVIIAIDTPINEDFTVDLSEIEGAMVGVREFDGLVILMSPVPVTSLKTLRKALGRDFVYNPENLRLNAGRELYIYAERQIIGCSKKLKPEMEKFYSWYRGELLFMSLESAAMVKHGVNVFLASSIILANRLKADCDKVGAKYDDVILGMKSDSRIGQKAYLTPGEPSNHLKRDLKILQSLWS